MTTNAPRLRLVEKTEVNKDLLIANLKMRGLAVVNETGASIQLKTENGTCCFIPQPLVGDSFYSVEQLEKIETALGTVEVELLPIDYNL